MKSKFIINDKVLYFDLGNLKDDSFVIHSSIQDYEVFFIDDEKLKKTLKAIKNLNQKKHFLFVDKNVSKINKKYLWPSEIVIDFDATEQSKTLSGVISLLNALDRVEFSKSNKLVSIGGGITQDVSIFATTVFKRGVEMIYIPTTLLSMSDSCIGSKSAINHNGTKNLIGLFSAPRSVFININFLKSLKRKEILSGYGEILKLCIIGGKASLNYFITVSTATKCDLLNGIENLIKISLLVKRAVIIDDEFESNTRKALNYGHTIGHAIEPIFDFKIPHGISVMIGMFIENCISTHYGYLSKSEGKMINQLILKYIDQKSLKLLKQIDLNLLYRNMEKDKKNVNNLIAFAVPIRIGWFNLIYTKNDKKLKSAIIDAFKEIQYK